MFRPCHSLPLRGQGVLLLLLLLLALAPRIKLGVLSGVDILAPRVVLTPGSGCRLVLLLTILVVILGV